MAGVIGCPIRHSLSPTLFNAAFEALGLEWVFVAFEVPDGMAAEAITGMRSLGLRGLSVTMPHKSAVSGLVDRLTPVAAVLEAVNSVYWQNGRLVGDSTDGEGFIDSLRAEGVEPSGSRVAVLGAGGAARAVVLALAGAGAGEVMVVNRTPAGAERAAALAPAVARPAAAGEAREADLIVNATSVGMAGDPASPLDPDLLNPGQVVVDLIYHPLVTPLLRAASGRGIKTVGGLGLLVHQAGHQLRRWTGEAPPLAAMAAAAEAGIGLSSSS